MAIVIVAPLLTYRRLRRPVQTTSCHRWQSQNYRKPSRREDKAEMAGLENKIYDLKHQALQTMADDYLIEEAAKSQAHRP